MEYVFSGVMWVRRLFMPDSKTRYLRLALMMLAWLVALELLLRLPPIKVRLERYVHDPVWYSPYVPQRMKLIRNNPDADVWFVGSSSVVLGVDPKIINPLLNDLTTTQHKTLNLGLLGMIYTDNLMNHVNNAFLTNGTPKVIVLGAFPELFAYSPKGYFEDTPEYEETRDRSTEFDRHISGWLYDHLALYKLVNTFRYLVAEMPAQEVNDTPTGHIGVDQTLRDIVPRMGNTNTNDLLEKNLALVKQFHDTLQARGIQLAFMNMPIYDPEMQDYPGGVDNYKAYISRLSSFLADEHIPFLDVWQALEDKHDQHLPAADFMDVPHLSEAGATDISPFITQFLATILEPASRPSP